MAHVTTPTAPLAAVRAATIGYDIRFAAGTYYVRDLQTGKAVQGYTKMTKGDATTACNTLRIQRGYLPGTPVLVNPPTTADQALGCVACQTMQANQAGLDAHVAVRHPQPVQQDVDDRLVLEMGPPITSGLRDNEIKAAAKRTAADIRGLAVEDSHWQMRPGSGTIDTVEVRTRSDGQWGKWTSYANMGVAIAMLQRWGAIWRRHVVLHGVVATRLTLQARHDARTAAAIEDERNRLAAATPSQDLASLAAEVLAGKPVTEQVAPQAATKPKAENGATVARARVADASITDHQFTPWAPVPTRCNTCGKIAKRHAEVQA